MAEVSRVKICFWFRLLFGDFRDKSAKVLSTLKWYPQNQGSWLNHLYNPSILPASLRKRMIFGGVPFNLLVDTKQFH